MAENVPEVFYQFRFETATEASVVAAGVDAMVTGDLGSIFSPDGRLWAAVTWPEGAGPGAVRVLYMTNGAIAAARLAGVRLPRPEGSVAVDVALRGKLIAGSWPRFKMPDDAGLESRKSDRRPRPS